MQPIAALVTATQDLISTSQQRFAWTWHNFQSCHVLAVQYQPVELLDVPDPTKETRTYCLDLELQFHC
jgi:hypothetical protein